MNDRERFLKWMLGEKTDRAPYYLFWGPWAHTTWQRWEREGKPESVTDHRSFMNPDTPPMGIPINCGPCPRIEPKILEEDDRTFVYTDSWGIKRRDSKIGITMPEFLEFPLKNRADWDTFRERWLNPDDPDRLAGDWLAHAKEWMQREWPIQLGYFPDVGVFGCVRWLLGDEDCLMAFYTMPDLVHDIMEHMTSIYLTVFEKVVRAGVRVDVIHIWEDMCGRNGPLISPNLFDEFMAPHYRRIKAFADANQIPLISVDTDGRPDLIIPPMMRAGVNFLFPFEVAAGCDVNFYRKQFPELAMLGGIDKRVLAMGREAIDRELERIRPAVESGRYIPDLDHLIPHDVSWDSYVHYATQLKKLCGKED